MLSNLGIISVDIIWHSLGAFGPAISAILIVYSIKGKDGLEELKERCFKWDVHWSWIILCFFGPFALFAIAVLINFFITNTWFDLLGYMASNGFYEFYGLGFLIWLWINALSYGIFEEIGWRGFALPKLQERHTALTATLILSIFWALWHIPAFFYKLPLTIVPFWFMGLIIGAIIMTFIFNSTKGSVLMVMLFHVINNIVMVLDVNVIATIMSIMLTGIAILIIIKWGKGLSTNEMYVSNME